MGRDLLTIRCPEDLLSFIDERVIASGKNKTEVVIELLRRGTGLNEIDNNRTNQDELEQLIESMIDDKLEYFINEFCNEIAEQNNKIDGVIERLGKN